jgi:hypothetical protein
MSNMSNLDALAFIFAFVTPYVIALVNRPKWTRTTKRLVMIGVAVVMAFLNALVRGDFANWNWDGFLPYLVAFIGAVQVLYAGLEAIKPTQKLLDKAEMVFTPVSSIEAARQKRMVNEVAVEEFKQNVGADQAA